MSRLFAGACALALVVATAAAQEKPALTGTWAREANGLDLKFQFAKDGTFKLSAFGGDNGVTLTCKYTVEKDGTVKATISKVEEKGSFPAKPAEGLEFSFKWKVKKNGNGELDDLKGKDLEDVKATVEGEYTPVKKK